MGRCLGNMLRRIFCHSTCLLMLLYACSMYGIIVALPHTHSTLINMLHAMLSPSVIIPHSSSAGVVRQSLLSVLHAVISTEALRLLRPGLTVLYLAPVNPEDGPGLLLPRVGAVGEAGAQGTPLHSTIASFTQGDLGNQCCAAACPYASQRLE